MNPSSEFNNPEYVQALSKEIAALAKGKGDIRLMHICGTHEHEIVKHGLRQLLPDNIIIVPGPGCPVCICPVEQIDKAITLSYQPGITLLTFGDMIRVPATRESLEDARRNGGSVQMVYSPMDAVKMASENPDQQYVFFSVGFETTIVGTAGIIQKMPVDNLSFLIANRYTPPALDLLLSVHQQTIQGFLLPGHASVITGLQAYRFMETRYQLPCVVTGFEAADILLGILKILNQMRDGRAKVENAYGRVVSDEGNRVAQQTIDAVFKLGDGEWRGIGNVSGSGYSLKEPFQHKDAEKRFNCEPPYPPRPHHPGCQCHKVMLGEITPEECSLFKTACTPESPFGPCMVSIEGTCKSWYTYGSGKLVLTD